MAADWSAATGVSTLVFEFAERALVDVPEHSFCTASCPLAVRGECDPQVAHRFGSYEAERWDGVFIYYCPLSLIFVAALLYEAGLPVHSLVTGPLVMGEMDDLLADLAPELHGRVSALPVRTPAEVGALSRVQQAVCRATPPVAPEGTAAHSTDASGTPGSAPFELDHHYPVEVEQRLVGMIRKGDRAGAAGLINQLLGVLYLATGGEVARLRQGAAELVTLFSRAAIEGGADAGSIFGEKRTLDRRLASFTTVDELSAFLVSVFNRFVGYVFDFSQFQHAHALRQVVNYVRAHYADRITLADAARQVWLSPSYLSSVFSTEMGMSFTAYVQTVRIDKSKELMVSTHQTVAEIAAAIGFADQSYFTKVFTRAVGVSPTQFRRGQVGDRG